MGKRRRAREMAMQMLYQQELGGCSLDLIFSSFDPLGLTEDADPDSQAENSASSNSQASGLKSSSSKTSSSKTSVPKTSGSKAVTSANRRRSRESFNYAQRLVEGTMENLPAIDRVIRRHAENWRLERMPAIDRNILRLAVYEMLHETRVPKVVIVDEAIELAKKYGSESSGRFVNGLLDGVLQARESALETA